MFGVRCPLRCSADKSASQSDDEVDSVVQPDVVVFCDSSKLTDFGARGAPDLAVEVLSPYTSKKDLNDKFHLYEQHGVSEYWVVDPAGSIQSFVLDKHGRYSEPNMLVGGGQLCSRILEGFTLDVAALFTE
ncbi:Uma2 family endonuclease [Spirochaeta africana]|uniref:Uma2 family endonuclease n=1 Tax=Spirochaeta africana TaxID=46355 RepID=UPI00145CB57D|nr:Uma2 family endonuclease [Spirochaeta africana]